MRVVVLRPYTKFEVRRRVRKRRTTCVSINGPGDLDLWPFDLETGMRVASKVGNLSSKFGHARPFGSRIIRYVRDWRTGGQTKATLIAAFTTGGRLDIIMFRMLAVPRTVDFLFNIIIAILLINISRGTCYCEKNIAQQKNDNNEMPWCLRHFHSENAPTSLLTLNCRPTERREDPCNVTADMLNMHLSLRLTLILSHQR